MKTTIAEIVEFLDYKRIPVSAKERETRHGKYPYYGAQGIVDTIDDYIFDGEYLLVAEDGENLRSKNQDIAQMVKGQFWVNNHAHILADNGNANLKFVCYLLNTIAIDKYITGSAQPKLSQASLSGIVVDIIDRNTQDKIVNVIDSLDRKISLNRKANEVLESMAKQLYDYWFVQFDFPNAEGKPYKSSGGKMVYNETLKREIPEGWEVKQLSEIGTFKNGINYDPNEQGNTEYRIVNVRNVSSTSLLIDASELDILLLDEHKANTYLIKEGDILITRSGNPGATRRYCEHEIPAVYCGFIICFTPSFEIQHNYLLMFLKDRETITSRLKGGSIMPNISQDALKPINLPIPSTDILKKFEDSIVPILSKLQATISEIKYLTSLRDYLLPLLMNGQVKVL